MFNYKNLYHEDYSDIVQKKENRESQTKLKDKVLRFYNYNLDKHIGISEYELWMFAKLAYSNDGVDQRFIDPFYELKYKIIDFINEEDGLQFYVIKSRYTKDLIIAFRGTDEWVDWLTNIQILKGKKRQFDTARKKLEKIFTHFSDYHLYLCGHSLGGALAQEMFLYFYLRTKLKLVKVVTFNSAGIRNKNDNPYSSLPIYNYIIEKDIVGNSTGYHYGNVVYLHPKIVESRLDVIKIFTHTLDQFIFDTNGNVSNKMDTLSANRD